MPKIRESKIGDDVKGLMETVRKRYKAFSDSEDSRSTQSSTVSFAPSVRQLLKSRARSPRRQGEHEGDSSVKMAIDEWRKSIETAIFTDNHNYLQDLIKGFDVKNDEEFSFLHLAVVHKNEACARKLIRGGWNVNAVDDTCRTPLHYAATLENASTVSILLKNGAKLSLLDSQGMTPCMYAANAGKDENLREMIEGAKRSDIHMPNKEGKTALHFAAVQEEPDCLKQLARYSTPIDISVQDNNYETPLHLAALGKHTRNVECLLEAGANPYAMAVDMLTPLHYSAFLWDTPTIKVFLDSQELDINGKTKNGKTVLHLATMVNHANANGSLSQADCVEFLLQCEGIKVNSLDDTKTSPLGYAVEHDYIISKLLIQAGASVNACEKPTPYATPPLHRAVQSNRPENVTLLLENGALVNIKGPKDKTALHVAMEEENEKCADILLQYGADPNITDEDGRRPMETAIGQNNHQLVCSILRNSVSEVPCIWTGEESTFKVTVGSLFPSADEPETNLLKKINDSFSDQNKREIFTIPATRAFIELKERILRKLELVWIVITLLYIGFSLQFLLRYMNCIFEKQTHSDKGDMVFDDNIPSSCTVPASGTFLGWILWAAFLPLYLVLRALEFSANFSHSIFSIDVFLDIVMLFSAIILCPWSPFSLQVQKVVSVVAATACGITLLLYLGTLLSCWRLHVLVFRHVLAAVSCILLVFLPLLLCFGFTLNLIFRGTSALDTFLISFMYIAGNTENYDTENKAALAILTSAFLFFILIIMMNLFTGISVLITSTLDKNSVYKTIHSRFLAIHSRERLLALLGKLNTFSLQSSLTSDLSIKLSEHPFRHLGCFARFKYNLLLNVGCIHAREVWPLSSIGFAKTDVKDIRITSKKKAIRQVAELRSSFLLTENDTPSDLAQLPVGHSSRRGELKLVEQRISQMQKKMERIEDLLGRLLSRQDECI